MNENTRTVTLTEEDINAIGNAAVCIRENREALSGIKDNSTGGDMTVLEVLELALGAMERIVNT